LVFLHPHSVVIQLLPYSVHLSLTWPQTAAMVNVRYIEWQLKNS